MRLLATTALLLTVTLPAIAAEPQLALNNLSHEFATCAAYFGVITVALENSNDLATAAKYQTLVGQALVYATTTGETIGLLPETTIARFDLAVEEMEERIGGNTSNISILLADHREPCMAAMDDPEARIDHWLAK